MSDERLREAERRWKESGSVEDEARYLLELVRIGRLERRRLEIAAACGHRGARRSLPDTSQLSSLAEIPDLGREACVVTLVACVSLLLDVFEQAFPGDARPRNALKGASDWIRCPCESHARAAMDTVDDADRAALDVFSQPRAVAAERPARCAVSAAICTSMENFPAETHSALTLLGEALPAEVLLATAQNAIAAWAVSGQPPL